MRPKPLSSSPFEWQRVEQQRDATRRCGVLSEVRGLDLPGHETPKEGVRCGRAGCDAREKGGYGAWEWRRMMDGGRQGMTRIAAGALVTAGGLEAWNELNGRRRVGLDWAECWIGHASLMSMRV